MASHAAHTNLYGMPRSAFAALSSMYADELAAKIKNLERDIDTALPPEQPFVVRLDGVAFSTFTKDLPRPFDRRLSNAMVATSVDLVEKFNAVCGYTQSDEISLVFPAAMGDLSPLFFDLSPPSRDASTTGDASMRGDSAMGRIALKAEDVNGQKDALKAGDSNGQSTTADVPVRPTSATGTNTDRKRKDPMDTDSPTSPSTCTFPPTSTTTPTSPTTTPTTTPTTRHPQKKQKTTTRDHRETQRTHIYAGRVQKLASVMAGYASARFNSHLRRFFGDAPVLESGSGDDLEAQPHDRAAPPLARAVLDKMTSGLAYFDGRVVPCTSNSELMEALFWRSNFDGFRNAIQQIARAEVMRVLGKSSRETQKRLESRGTRELLRILVEELKCDVFGEQGPAPIPKRFLYGTWVKKEQYEILGMVNPKTGVPVQGPVVRGRVRVGSFNWAEWPHEDRVKFTLAKYWPDWDGREPPRDSLEASEEVVNGSKRTAE
ncbi:hypothetical protein M427DRAFT_113653 [Gonapodya prolifera JEL478]|uniref:tRNA(His) guanylyltransferase n=1 Tax=Gonapodya prolifera (strain JEL478) TaxID=1344416 RepID=A0A139A8I5_GONPJ|nr:hypothetical protein M427DRAFT_113653 [Gonapodya prolifera JEL478]|eukprot:KXS13116.1 hypothetical protein M427DRAFT_113653 [Gonapodya prolifera JEL478]